MYALAKPLLFLFPEEATHRVALHALSVVARLLPKQAAQPPVVAPKTLMGLRFPNPIGAAAGLDKDATCVAGLGLLGFGFIEVGTVTPLPQSGNAKPRLFRLAKDQAIINRMGFNNHGLEACIQRLSRRNWGGILGVNIGKNANTKGHAAIIDDYCRCLEAVYPHADYVTLNLSSPNTPGLRDLQTAPFLNALLEAICRLREELAAAQSKHVPILLKIAPDLDQEALAQMIDQLIVRGVEGVIATNTTTQRPVTLSARHKTEIGGLSGAPLHDLAVAKVERIRALAGDALTVVGVGGVMRPAHAVDFFNAGADLVQLYSGLIYAGPRLPKQLLRALRESTPPAATIKR